MTSDAKCPTCSHHPMCPSRVGRSCACDYTETPCPCSPTGKMCPPCELEGFSHGIKCVCRGSKRAPCPDCNQQPETGAEVGRFWMPKIREHVNYLRNLPDYKHTGADIRMINLLSEVERLERRLENWGEMVAALRACQRMESVYTMWRMDDDEGFEEAAKADGVPDVLESGGHEYLEHLRDKAIRLTNDVLSRIQSPGNEGG